MPDNGFFEITSPDLRHLQETFDRAPALVEDATGRAMANAVAVTHQRVAERTPTRTGAILAQIKDRIEGDGAMITGTVSLSGQLGLWLEYGTAPHVIVPVRARALRFALPVASGNRDYSTQAGDVVFAMCVNHPGTKPYRMFEDGALAAEPDVHRAFAQAMAEVVEGLNAA